MMEDLSEFDRTVGNAMITTAGFVILALLGLAIWVFWAVLG